MKKVLLIFALILCVFLSAEETKKPVRVYVDVVGDLFHAGHIEFLKKAKAEGDYLL